MANEITLSASVRYAPDTFSAREIFAERNKQFDQTTKRRLGDTRNVGTSEETITLDANDITTPGLLMLYNADATNYVQIGFATGVYPLRLAADQFAVMWLDGSVTTLYVKANTAAVDLDWQVLEQ